MFSRCYKIIALFLLLCGGVWWWLHEPEDPRAWALGEWKEASSRLQVEVGPEQAEWRGMGRGRVRYEWVQVERAPYRLRFVYRGKTIEANLTFDGKNTAIFEPDVWENLPELAQQQLRDLNRRHNRPEKEFRLLFRRVEEKAVPKR